MHTETSIQLLELTLNQGGVFSELHKIYGLKRVIPCAEVSDGAGCLAQREGSDQCRPSLLMLHYRQPHL